MSNNSIFKIGKDGTTLARCSRRAFGDVNLPSEVTVIGKRAFADCRGVQSILVPDQIVKIEANAFYNAGLNWVVFNSTQSIGPFAFADCRFLKEICIPCGVQTISDWAFSETGITQVSLPTTITTIGNGAFSGSRIITAAFENSQITDISPQSFEFCSNLRFVRLPSTLKKIGYGAFSMCFALEKIELPEGLELVERYAFHECASLREIKIPNSVKRIEHYAFERCPNLDHIEVNKDCKVDPRVGCTIIYRD